VLVEPLIGQLGHGTEASLGSRLSREVHSPGNDGRSRRETTWAPGDPSESSLVRPRKISIWCSPPAHGAWLPIG